MKQLLTLLCVLFCLISFSQTEGQLKNQPGKTTIFVSFNTKLDTAQAQKNGFSLNGYLVNIRYDRARKLHGKKIKITGKVTILKGLKNDPNPDIRAGWEDDVKYIASPKITFIKN